MCPNCLCFFKLNPKEALQFSSIQRFLIETACAHPPSLLLAFSYKKHISHLYPLFHYRAGSYLLLHPLWAFCSINIGEMGIFPCLSRGRFQIRKYFKTISPPPLIRKWTHTLKYIPTFFCSILLYFFRAAVRCRGDGGGEPRCALPSADGAAVNSFALGEPWLTDLIRLQTFLLAADDDRSISPTPSPFSHPRPWRPRGAPSVQGVTDAKCVRARDEGKNNQRFTVMWYQSVPTNKRNLLELWGLFF